MARIPINTPRLPPPPPRYDQRDQEQTRAAIERALAEIAQALQRLTEMVEKL